MKVDYLVVGAGLAGMAFAEILASKNKTFLVFNNHSQNASVVAGGMYNPVILKRFTPVWDAENQLQTALPFYNSLEEKFNTKFDFKTKIARVFKTTEEQNNWFAASDKPLLKKYLKANISTKPITGLNSPFGYGIVNSTGRINTKMLLTVYENYLIEKRILIEEEFKHSKIIHSEEKLIYDQIEAKHIVFCEGYGIKNNPFFNHLPLNGTKGELLTINAPELKLDKIAKGPVFIMPIKEHVYKVGATFNWTDKTLNPTEKGKEELLTKLKQLINVPFEIIDHQAGIRPTVKDRRPLLGTHAKHKNLAILNGLGTRGVMLAPKMAMQLYNFLEEGISLDNEVNINRFY